MALTATVYALAVDLQDTDRNVYTDLELRVARHPSESESFLLTRVLAYCLEYAEGIAFAAGGISATDEPAIVVRDLTGRITAWIEIGAPDAERLHRGSRIAGRVAVWTHRDPATLLRQLQGERIHCAAEIPIHSFDRGWIDAVAPRLGRRAKLGVSVAGRHLWLDLDGETFETDLHEHRISD